MADINTTKEELLPLSTLPDTFPFDECYKEGESKKELIKRVLAYVFGGRRIKEEDKDKIRNALTKIFRGYAALGVLLERSEDIRIGVRVGPGWEKVIKSGIVDKDHVLVYSLGYGGVTRLALAAFDPAPYAVPYDSLNNGIPREYVLSHIE